MGGVRFSAIVVAGLVCLAPASPAAAPPRAASRSR